MRVSGAGYTTVCLPEQAESIPLRVAIRRECQPGYQGNAREALEALPRPAGDGLRPALLAVRGLR